MCRLFGMHAGDAPVPATFWLLDAPDSLAAQSHRNPDGAGIGASPRAARSRLDKSAVGRLAGRASSPATPETARHDVRCPRPLRQYGRPHAWPTRTRSCRTAGCSRTTGSCRALTLLDARLDELGARGLVAGETDSERVFALVTAEIRPARGTCQPGSVAAVALDRRRRCRSMR